MLYGHSVMRGQSLPEMSKPPVAEVVCGAFFGQLEKLDGLSLGAYWSERQSDFPERNLLMAVHDNTEPTIETGLPPVRSWMISASEEYIVQLQKDRFYLNWRAGNSRRYPRFRNGVSEGIASLLAKEFMLFSDFCEQAVHERPNLLEGDIAKINLLIQGEHWVDFDDLKAMLPMLNGMDTAIGAPTPELSLQLIDQRDWSTLIKIQSGREPEGEKRQLVRLEIRARSSLSKDSFDATFDVLNERINSAFLRLVPRQQMIARFGGRE